MTFGSISRALLLALSATTLTSVAFGQATAYPVVDPSSIGPDESRPNAWVVVPADQQPGATLVNAPGQSACNDANPCYYTEQQIWTAYGLTAIQKLGNYGAGITVGIVDAFYDAQTATNLGKFSIDFSLPQMAGSGLVSNSSITCPAAPTISIVSQTGGAPTAAFNANWAEEINLDVQQVHSMAPCANILLIAATNNSNTNLYAGVKYAYAHSDIVTDSWGGGESAAETSADANFSPSTVPVLFSAGDTGAASEYPCMSPNVTCIGGTTLLTTATSFRTNEYPWGDPGTGNSAEGGTGGGCSPYEAQPAFQQGIPTGFTNTDCGAFRGAPDISALADEFTGVTIYLGANVGLSGGAALYCCIGGTSLASPLTAGILADVDGARVATGKSKLGSNLNTLIYQQAAAYSPSGTSTLPAPYGSAYHTLFYDVYHGNSGPGQAGGYPATLFWDKASGLGVPMFSALGAYLTNVVP